MREFVRPLALVVMLALGVSGVGSIAALLVPSAAMAQNKPPADAPAQPAMKQIALTQKQIDGVLASAKEMNAIADKLPENAAPDPKVTTQFEAVAKKNGFAGYDEYGVVVDNIGLVMAGFDPATKKYVGADAVIKAQITRVQADNKMPAKDRQQALADLNEALKHLPPAIENQGNIDLVAKNYDKLTEVMGDEEE